MKNLLFILSVFILSSCAKDYVTNVGTGNGSIMMKPTKPTGGTYVTVDDELVIDNKNVKSVKITGLEDGETKVIYKSESSSYKVPLNYEKTITIENGSDKTEIVDVPPYSTGYWIYTLGSPIVTLILLGALAN